MNIPMYLLGACVASFVGWVVYDQIRLRRRRGLSRDEFAEVFRGEGVPYKIAAAVYDYYSSIGVGRGYAVSPNDAYEGLLHEGQEDIDGDAESLVAQLRMRLPDESVLPSAARPLKTVRDMVLWLNWVRQHQSS